MTTISTETNKPEVKKKEGLSGLVVCFNEASKLATCLSSLGFCDEVVVIDLGSTDESQEVATGYGAKVFQAPWVSIGEQVWPIAERLVKHEWILRIDPDEVVPDGLGPQIVEIIQDAEDVGTVRIPYQYFFRRRPVKHGFWGGILRIPKLVHRERVEVHSHVHRGTVCKSGFRELTMEASSAVEHYWVETFRELIEKHRRYLPLEGVARHNLGQRFSWRKLIFHTGGALKRSMIDKQGYRSPTGLFLSFFYCLYVAGSWLSLREVERQRKQ